MTDLPAALQQAEQEGKLVLVDFTGSDWCSACIVLRRTVLDTPEFREFAAGKFVLMEVDLPMKEGMNPELRRRNEEIAKRYGVGGFPTVMVLDPQGRVMGLVFLHICLGGRRRGRRRINVEAFCHILQAPALFVTHIFRVERL